MSDSVWSRFVRSPQALIACGLMFAFAAGSFPGLAGKGEPDRVTVQHVLIGFKKSVRGKELNRTKKEAEALAEEILKRAQAGEKFGDLVQEYTDDRPPGIYVMVNTDQPKPAAGFHRSQMAANFGRVSFGLEVGEIGIARYHPGNSPYGWHVIKRLE